MCLTCMCSSHYTIVSNCEPACQLVHVPCLTYVKIIIIANTRSGTRNFLNILTKKIVISKTIMVNP